MFKFPIRLLRLPISRFCQGYRVGSIWILAMTSCSIICIVIAIPRSGRGVLMGKTQAQVWRKKKVQFLNSCTFSKIGLGKSLFIQRYIIIVEYAVNKWSVIEPEKSSGIIRFI